MRDSLKTQVCRGNASADIDTSSSNSDIVPAVLDDAELMDAITRKVKKFSQPDV